MATRLGPVSSHPTIEVYIYSESASEEEEDSEEGVLPCSLVTDPIYIRISVPSEGT